MDSINLLPPELAPKSKIIKLSGIFKKIATVGFLVYIVYLAFWGYFVYSKDRALKTDLSKFGGLSKSVEALQETEQRFIIIQNRLGYVQTIKTSFPTIVSHIDLFQKVWEESPEGAILKGFKINPTEVTFSAQMTSSEKMEDFLAYLQSFDKITSVTMISFSYLPTSGYMGNFTMTFTD